MARLNVQIMSACIGLLAICLYSGISLGDSGGTDGDISMNGDAGGSGEYAWNATHGFVLIDDGEKVDEEFNVTACEAIKGDPGEETPDGHIFGELHGIVWTDSPEPEIQISDEDFQTYKDEDGTLTVYVYGEYYHGLNGERYAYKTILVKEPNHKPNAVGWISVVGEWKWYNLSEEENLTFTTEQDESTIEFCFNGSESWDPDGDEITAWNWDLNKDAQCGNKPGERSMNTTWTYGKGSHDLAIMVSDGDKASQFTAFTITVKEPERKPDLTITNISVANVNGLDYIEKNDTIDVILVLKNIGTNFTDEVFHILYEFYEVDDRGDPIEFKVRILGGDIHEVNGYRTIDFKFYTETEDFIPTTYSLRLTLDINGEIDELNETNNQGEFHNITLLPPPPPGDPIISIIETTISNFEPWINEYIWINLTIANTGNKHARYIDIYFYVNDEFQYYITIDFLEHDIGNKTVTIAFSGDSSGEFALRFAAHDDGLERDTTENYSIYVRDHWKHPDLYFKNESIQPGPYYRDHRIVMQISAENQGDWPAHFVEILSFRNGNASIVTSVETIAENDWVNLTISFTFYETGMFNISFELMDDGEIKDRVNMTIEVEVHPDDIPHAVIESITPNPAKNNEVVIFHASHTGNTTVAQYVWMSSIMGIIEVNVTSPMFSIAGLPVGNHTITLRIIDTHGVVSENVTTTLLVEEPKENSRPTVVITSPTYNELVSGTITIAGTASDEDGSVWEVQVFVVKEGWTLTSGINQWNFNFDTKIIDDGEYTILVRAYDGTAYSSIVTVKVIVDNGGDVGGDGHEEGEGIPAFETMITILSLSMGLVCIEVRRRR